MMQQIIFSSKAALKQQALHIAGGNIKEAKELYDFLISDIPDLPDTDPSPVTWQDSTKDTVNGILNWLKENKDTLAQGYDFVRGVLRKSPANPAPAAPLPNINHKS